MKVYCTYCKHDKYTSDDFGGTAWCNVVVGRRKSYRYPSKIYLKQEEANKDNNCKYFYPSIITKLSKRRQRLMEEYE